jgi:N utilization substance protein B
MLFQLDLTGASVTDVFEEFWKGHSAGDDVRSFAERLVHGVLAHRDFLDRVVRASAEHWRIERMAVVDRNVLRMGVYELVYETDTPPVVVIDEAIEVAKKFGSVESGSFINGVLDDVRRRSRSGELRAP